MLDLWSGCTLDVDWMHIGCVPCIYEYGYIEIEIEIERIFIHTLIPREEEKKQERKKRTESG